MATNFQYIAKLGGTASGDGNSQFNAPKGMVTDGIYLWVCDTGNHRIKKLTLTGLGFVAHWGDVDVSTGDPTSGTGNTGFSSPTDIILRDGYLFISDTGNNRIKIHRATDGKYINQITGFSSPKGMAMNRQFFWVCNSGSHQIRRYRFSDLSLIESQGSLGAGNTTLSSPEQIAYDPAERVIYIADTVNNRIVKWDAFGFAYRDDFGGTLVIPKGVAVKDYVLYVVELHTITAYETTDLSSQDSEGSDGSGNANISAGAYIIAWQDSLIFSDTGNNRIAVWQNYKVNRAFTSGSTRKITGGFFVDPTVAIGEKVDEDDYTIGGTETKDKTRWIASESDHHALGWVQG